jgi:hypothetical protein
MVYMLIKYSLITYVDYVSYLLKLRYFILVEAMTCVTTSKDENHEIINNIVYFILLFI